ncbi:MAG: CRISPR-associated endonuclease Cas3'' [Lentisphaerae bacterium]|nr:CRISPR-associated endonuclease Cas3'' [Lentisphaerota bacterium]
MKSYAYWGKVVDADDTVCHRLVYHCLDVAAVAERLINCDARWGASVMRAAGQRDALGLVSFLVALHDAGKFADGFQNQRADIFRRLRGTSSAASYRVRHDAAGLLALREIVWPILYACFSLLPFWSASTGPKRCFPFLRR